MDLPRVQAFVAVAELQSFVRAGERLHLSQPAVTKRVRGFEQEAGGPVFTRGQSGVVLTELGHGLLTPAREALDAFDRLQRAMDRRRGAPPRLNVASPYSIANHLLPALLWGFGSANVGVRAGSIEAVLGWVRSGAVDVGIVRRTGAEEGLLHQPLYQEELVLVARPDHPLAGRDDIGREAWIAHPMIDYGPPSDLMDLTRTFWARQGGPPPATVRVDQAEAMRRMVLAGLGAGLLPLSTAWEEIAAGRLVRLRLGGRERMVFAMIAVHRPDNRSPARDRFVEHLRRGIAHLPCFGGDGQDGA